MGEKYCKFLFIYFLGHGIRMKYFFSTLTLKSWIMIYLGFNILECTIIYLSLGHRLAVWLYTYGWTYNSPLLIINAISFFMIFSKLRIESHFISSVARSVFPVYLIHSNLNVQNVLWPIVKSMYCGNLLIANIIVASFIMLMCILIDKLMTPCYHKIGKCLINNIILCKSIYEKNILVINAHDLDCGAGLSCASTMEILANAGYNVVHVSNSRVELWTSWLKEVFLQFIVICHVGIQWKIMELE